MLPFQQASWVCLLSLGYLQDRCIRILPFCPLYEHTALLGPRLLAMLGCVLLSSLQTAS